MAAVTQPDALIPVDEYLTGEQSSEIRHEYIGGRVYAMVGASDRHGLLVMNIGSALHHHLRGGPCQVFVSDMKVRLKVADETVFYYPDILVSCAPDDRERLYRQKPSVLIEVLSEATERTDRREKFLAYQTIETLKEYVLVGQDAPALEVFRRANGWKTERLGPGDTLKLDAVSFALPVAGIYEGVL